MGNTSVGDRNEEGVVLLVVAEGHRCTGTAWPLIDNSLVFAVHVSFDNGCSLGLGCYYVHAPVATEQKRHHETKQCITVYLASHKLTSVPAQTCMYTHRS